MFGRRWRYVAVTLVLIIGLVLVARTLLSPTKVLVMQLKLIEADLEAQRGDAGELLSRLDQLEERADHLPIPLAFAQILYNLRSHIALARTRLTTASNNRHGGASSS